MVGGCQELEVGKNGEVLFDGYGVSVLQGDKVLEIGSTIM